MDKFLVCSYFPPLMPLWARQSPFYWFTSISSANPTGCTNLEETKWHWGKYTIINIINGYAAYITHCMVMHLIHLFFLFAHIHLFFADQGTKLICSIEKNVSSSI
jgi:hypothetical protein